jgi:septum formation protein
MFILASTSSTRKALLSNAGLFFQSLPPKVQETELQSNNQHLSAVQLAERLAQAKAESLCQTHPEHMIVGADQVLDLGGEIIHKPNNTVEARAVLQKLRGRKHTLTSALCCYQNQNRIWSVHRQAHLHMRNFSDQFLDQHLETKAPEHSWTAGAYQLETDSIQLFESIEGDYFTILGFPLLDFLAFLRQQAMIAA